MREIGTMRLAYTKARIITIMILPVVIPRPAAPTIAIPVRVTMGAGVIPAAVSILVAAVSILVAAALIRAVAVEVVIAGAAVVVVIQAVKLIVKRRDTLIVSHRLILL